MKLTVLGCWAPYPRAGGACSGYLVQTADKNILLECGNGVLSNLQKYIDFRRLDAVIVSHLHPDHYMDLYCLRHAIEGARRLNKDLQTVPLIIPQNPEQPFNQLQGYTNAFKVTPVEHLTLSSIGGREVYRFALGNTEIFMIKTDHPLPAYALLLKENETKMFFSADTKWCNYLPGFAEGANICLCEASVIEEDSEYADVGHLTAKQAGRLASQAGAGKLIITHFWPEYELSTIKSEAEAEFGRSVIIATEGLQVDV